MEHPSNVKDLKTGTTTVGLIAGDTVVLAADMRASMGNLAYDEESEKIYQITDFMGVTNAGNVGDSLTIIRFLKSQAKLFEIEREERMTPRAASTLLSNVLNASRYYPYIVQLIVGGVNNKAELFEVTPFGATLERKKYAATGSGTDFAMNTLDQNYTLNMNEEDAIKLAIKAIEAGKKRDIYSGGESISVSVINRSGYRELSRQEVNKYLGEMNGQPTSAKKTRSS
ncbi:MAG: proteasome subunit beta [archaeon]|nr:proteasome subunit beta [archaeon]